MAQRMPINEEMKCPPTKGQGLATGLWGMANRITADAPMDAKSVFKPPPSMVKLASQPVRKIANPATKAVRIFSANAQREGFPLTLMPAPLTVTD